MGWDPILEGEQAAHAQRVLREIAEALAEPVGPIDELALFWTYAAAALDDDPLLAARVPALAEAAMARFAAELSDALPPTLALHGGLAGTAWVAGHITDGADAILDAVDRALGAALEAPWTATYDLIGGLVGFGVYLMDREGSADGLAQIVAQLAARAVRMPEGVAWFTAPGDVGIPHRARYPDGYYNCGIAHGVPGVIAVLSRIAARPELDAAHRAIAIALRDGGTSWLLAQRLPGGSFPAAAGGELARTAWCYGDPGVAIALWLALPTVRRDELALGWVARAPVGVRDAALCHGSAGLAHICNRMFQATRDPRYRDGARRFFADVLARHQPGTGIGGFVMERAGKPLVTPSLVEGTIGVGLALLAAIAPLEPGWDRLFLCDLPILGETSQVA